MGIKRIVDTSFWTDGKVDEFSPEDKYFMLYLLTNPFSKQLGIYEISIKHVAFQLGYSIDAVKVLLDRFEKKYGIIIFSSETNEIAILNFLRHSIIKGGKPVEDCIRKEMALVKNKSLIDAVFSHLRGRDGLNFTVNNIINSHIDKNNDFEDENDNDNNNDDDVENKNDNDNERIVNESSTNRQRIVGSNNGTQIDYNDVLQSICGNVMMSENQIGDLLDKIGLDAFDYYIKRVSDFIANGGYVKNPYQTILKWYEEDSKITV
mgnify:FL=1